MNRDVKLSGDTKGELWKYLFAYELFENAKEGYGTRSSQVHSSS